MSQQSYELAARAYQEAIDLASFANAMPLISSEMIISSSFLSKIYAHQAIAYLNLGNFKAGVSSAQNAVIKNPKSFIANYNLALLLLSNRQHQQALEIFTIANRLQSKDSDSEEAQNIYILTGQGLSLAGLGRTQEALNLLNQVINLAPSYLPARNAQACIMERINQATVIRIERSTRINSDNLDNARSDVGSIIDTVNIRGCAP